MLIQGVHTPLFFDKLSFYESKGNQHVHNTAKSDHSCRNT